MTLKDIANSIGSFFNSPNTAQGIGQPLQTWAPQVQQRIQTQTPQVANFAQQVYNRVTAPTPRIGQPLSFQAVEQALNQAPVIGGVRQFNRQTFGPSFFEKASTMNPQELASTMAMSFGPGAIKSEGANFGKAIVSKIPQASGGVKGLTSQTLPVEANIQEPQILTGQKTKITSSPLVGQPNPGISLPQSISQDTRNIINGANVKERGFITSVKESTKTPQPVKDLISGTYIVKSGDQLRKDAQALIKADPATAEKLALNPQNDTHIQIGNELINYYGSQGNFAKAQQITEGMANAGTDFGRAVQAFANYDKTTPQGAIRFAQSKVNEYNKLNPQAKLKINDSQVQSLFNRAKNIQSMADGRDRNIAANDLINEVNSLIPSSVADKAVTLWKAGLLTSLRTHERNLLGNTIHGVAETAKDIPAMVADRIMGLKTGQRSMTATINGVGSGTKTGLQSAKDIVTKGYDPEQAIGKYDVRHITWGNNPVEQGLKKYTDAVFRTLGAEDKPFYNASFARSLYDQAGAAAINAGKQGDKSFIGGLVKTPTPEMLQTAIKDAEVATFHNQTAIGKIGQAIQQFKPLGIPVGQVVAPFTGVPSAIAGQLIAYSPAGLIKGIATAGKVVAGNVPDLQRQAAQEIGRGVIGTGLIGIGAFLAQQGLITGQPKNSQEAAQWQLEGKQANSVLVNGKWRAIGSVGPENLMVLAGAKAQQELGGGNPDVGKYAAGVGQDFLGQTFLQGVQQPLAAFNDPARYGQSYIGNQGSSIVPNIVKDASKAGDPYARQNNNLGDYFTNSIPGLRNQNIVKRDALGNPVPQEPTGPGAFVDLFNSKTPISNSVVNELSRLNGTGNNATPSTMGKSQTINGVKTSLTPAQLDVLNSNVGPQATQALQSLFQNPQYQSLPDDEKAKAVDSVITAVRKQVRGTIDLNSTSSSGFPAGSIVNGASLTGNSGTGGLSGTYTLVDPATGNVKQIDLTKTLTPPTLTGSAALDKIATSKYNSAVSSRASDIYALYQAGKITQDQASQALTDLASQKIAGAKKPRKIALIRSPKAAKITTFKSKKASAAKFKLPKSPTLKLSKTKTLKTFKIPSSKFKNSLTA